MNRAARDRRRRLRRELKQARRDLAAANWKAELLEARAAGLDVPSPGGQTGSAAESMAYHDWLTPLFDRIEEYRQFPEFFPPFNTLTDHHLGANWPFWRTEPELSFLRSLARVVTTTNANGAGLLRGLSSYVVGRGMTPRCTTKDANLPSGVVDQCQDVIDDFTANCTRTHQRQTFAQYQRVLFRSALQNGEFLLRFFFRPDGTTAVRVAWPEQLMRPPGSGEEYTFGVLSDLYDTETVHEYYLASPHDMTEGERVPASEILHFKRNADPGVKRGMPDFAFDVREVLENVRKLRRNMALGAALQAAVAWVEQYSNSTRDAVAGIATNLRDFNTPRTSLLGDRDRDVESVEGGNILRMSKNKEFVAGPGVAQQGATSGFVAVAQFALRSLATYWNAPEWLSSSDASSTNYASSLTAESPFVKSVEAQQDDYADAFRDALTRVLRHAGRSGRLPKGWDLVEVQVEAPRVQVRDPDQEMQRHQGYIQMGLLSPQTATQEAGYDYENEQTNIEEANSRQGSQGLSDTGPADAGGAGANPLAALMGETAESDGAGFTGYKTDSLGRRNYYVNGKRTKAPEAGEKGNRRRAKAAADDDTDHAAAAKEAFASGDAAALAGHLSKLNAKELNALKKEVGVKGGRTNEDKRAAVIAALRTPGVSDGLADMKGLAAKGWAKLSDEEKQRVRAFAKEHADVVALVQESAKEPEPTPEPEKPKAEPEPRPELPPGVTPQDPISKMTRPIKMASSPLVGAKPTGPAIIPEGPPPPKKHDEANVRANVQYLEADRRRGDEKAFARRLANAERGSTPEDFAEIKKRLGLTEPQPQPEAAPAAGPEPKAEPGTFASFTPEDRDALFNEAYGELTYREENNDGLVRTEQLFGKLRAVMPDLTPEQFTEHLRAMQKRGLQGRIVNETHRMSDEWRAVSPPRGDAILGYVYSPDQLKRRREEGGVDLRRKHESLTGARGGSQPEPKATTRPTRKTPIGHAEAIKAEVQRQLDAGDDTSQMHTPESAEKWITDAGLNDLDVLELDELVGAAGITVAGRKTKQTMLAAIAERLSEPKRATDGLDV